MRRSFIRLCATLALALSVSSPAQASEPRVALAPVRPPAWRASSVLESLRGGARAPRELRIETSPRGARLELAYLRDGAQLARASGAAPIVAVLPGRALTGVSDRVIVRAELDGFVPHELSLMARDPAPSVRIELAPAPRRLIAASLLVLGERARLELISDRAIEARLAESPRGWRLVLADVAPNEEIAARLHALRGGAIAGASVRVAGGDWLIDLMRAREERRTPRLLRRAEPVRAARHLTLE
jgi:hypothetical protein